MKNINKIIAKIILISFIITTILTQYNIAWANNDVKSGNVNKREYKEIIVKYKDQNNNDSLKATIKKSLKLSKLNSKKKIKRTNIELLEVGEKDDINKVIKELNSNPNVQYAQPNYMLTTSTLPSDQRFSEQWGLENNGQVVGGQTGVVGVDINALQAWDVTKGSQTVVIGVLDSGIDINHPDLYGNIYSNTYETPNNGVDDDGNGFVDDINGWDFLNNDKTVYDSSTSDIHGTHVAGIIAASANNQGVIGVAPNVKILPLKFIDGTSGYTSDAIEAIDYANRMGVKIINCSWGGTVNNIALRDAMQNTDILFVCAAGNSGSNSAVNPNYPANFDLPNILSVAAMDNRGDLATFSNYGDRVQVAAPGVNILSTLPENSYGIMSGTSMAAPYVTGIAALIKSTNSGVVFSDISDRIKSNVVLLQSLVGKVTSGGRVDTYTALNNSGTNYPNEVEPNNSVENATQVQAGKINGSITDQNDIDWYKINPQQAKPVSIKLSEIPSGNDFDLELYAPDMTKIGYSYNTRNTDETVKLTPDIQGTYYLKVMPNTYNGTGEQKYSLNIDLYDGTLAVNEPNNTNDVSTSIMENKPYYSTIDSPSDVDWYSVDISKAGKLVTTLRNIPEGSNFDIEVYNSNGEVVGSSNNGQNMEEKSDILINNPGRYYIKVYSNYQENILDSYRINLNDTSNDYSITTYPNIGASTVQPYEIKAMVVSADSFENNDNYNSAKQINLSDSINATIDNDKDEDWYKFNLSELTSTYIKLNNIPSGCDYDLTIFDSNLNYISGSYKRGSISEESNAQMGAGTYYVKVSSYSGYSDQNHYNLIVSQFKLDDYESNDTFATAKEININQSIMANIHNLNDQDWYKVNFAETGKIDISLGNIPTNCNYELELYNAENVKIGESKLEGNNDEVIWQDIAAGDYFVKVYSISGSDIENNYSLTVNRNIGLENVETIGENSSSVGRIVKNYGSNWYKLTSSGSGMLTLNLDYIPADCYYKVVLYDQDGYSLSKSDSVSETQQSIDFIVTEPSTYYIKVYSIYGYNENADYTLTTSLTYIADLDVPKKIADAVTLGASQTNALLTNDELNQNLTSLPEEVTDIPENLLPTQQAFISQGLTTSINEAQTPNQNTAVNIAEFSGNYTTISEQTNCTINVNGVDEAAQELQSYNVFVNGALQSSDANDYYIFRNNQKGKAIIEIDNAPVGANLKILLTAENWNGGYWLSDGVNHDAYVATIITDATSQYYIVRVSGTDFTTSNVSYKLKITFIPEDFVSAHDSTEMRNNDYFSNARYVYKSYSSDTISYSTQKATIDFRHDCDTYKLNLDSGYKFSAVLRSPEGHGSYYYVLTDSSYNIVDTNIFNASDQNGVQIFEMLYNVAQAGTYYLVVFSNESSSYNAFSQYQVDFYCNKNNEAMEYNSSAGHFNESFEFATSISLNTTYSCKLDSQYDNDAYKIYIPSEGKLTISLDKFGYNENYLLFIEDLNGQYYQYLSSKSDYVFYAQSAGTYKVAIARRNLSTPNVINYALTAAFTPKASFDAYEYVKNTDISTPYKNFEFLLSNNQYLFVNGISSNLTEINTDGKKSFGMDNLYDVDWFKIDTTKILNNKHTAKIALSGISSGDNYDLIVADSNGNMIGSGTKSSNQNEQINLVLNKTTNRYYYIGVFVKAYAASNHTANLSVTFNNDGLVSNIGLNPEYAINGYSYNQLLNEQPTLKVESTGSKVELLQYIYRALGFTIDNAVLGTYDSWQTICATRALMAYFGNEVWIIPQYRESGSNITGTYTWPKLIDLIDMFGSMSETKKVQLRAYFDREQQNQIAQAMGWELDLKLSTAVANDGTVTMNASCASCNKISLKVQKGTTTVWSDESLSASITRTTKLTSGSYTVVASAEKAVNGKTYQSYKQSDVNVSIPASSISVADVTANSVTLNITNPTGKTLKVYTVESNGSLTIKKTISLTAGSTSIIVGDLSSGNKYRFEVFSGSGIGEGYVIQNTNSAYFDDDDVISNGYKYDYIESIGLGIASSIIENGGDSINMTSAIFYQIFVDLGLPQAITDTIYVNFADRKDNVLQSIRSKVKNQEGYYLGRVITDSALATSAVQGAIAGVELIMAGITGEVASAAAEALSLGTGTPVLALTTAVSATAVAVGAVVAVGSISLSVTSGESLVDDFGKLKNASSSNGNSTKLRKNMIEAGIQEPGYKPNVAHHIVPATAQKAQVARDILKKCGIDDINCAENGVFLPGEEGLAGAGNASVHTGRHLDSYIDTVTERLKNGLPANPTSANRQTAINILNQIRQELLNGTLKLQN